MFCYAVISNLLVAQLVGLAGDGDVQRLGLQPLLQGLFRQDGGLLLDGGLHICPDGVGQLAHDGPLLGGAFDTVTWVPVSPRRLRQRGYDQARLLAESACRLWETKPLPLLRKTVHNPAQSGLKEAAARRANVLGVYEAVDPERISGHRILLVDDICTTGATLAECARVLREAGAADVVCAAAALTPLERDSGKKA